MSISVLTAVISLLGLLATAIKWVANWTSDGSVLRLLPPKIEHEKGRREVERERLRRTYDRIDQEPPKTGDDLGDSLNDKFKQ
jgi:hypothetical protein